MSQPGQNPAPPAPQVYIVDDEPILLDLAGTILRHHGYTFKTFIDPVSALESYTVATTRPGLIITDYAMSPLNGMDLTRELRKLAPSQKILMVSGTAGEEIFIGATCIPDAFLPKPYLAESFMTYVRKFVI